MSDMSVVDEVVTDDQEPPTYAAAGYVVPKVNLLPPEMAERAKLRRIQAGLAAAAVLCVACVGGLYYQATNDRTPAKEALRDAQDAHTAIAKQQTALGPDVAKQADLVAQRQALSAALGSEVLWSNQLDGLRAGLPDDVRLSSLTIASSSSNAITSSTSSSSVTLPANPSGTTVTTTSGTGSASTIATITISGVADDLNAVADALEAFSSLDGWTNVYLTNTSRGSASSLLNYSITANLSSAALSHRYTQGS